MREALNYVGWFVGSGHVDSEKILSIMERSGKYFLPLHEFLRAVIHKNAEHYDPTDSPILNLYDLSSNTPDEHFALLVLLDYVERAGQVGGLHGFVERGAVLSYLQTCGFSVEQSLAHLRRAFEHSLLTSPEGLKGEGGDRMRITSAGAYSRKKLAALFAYLDAVVVETPITEPGCRNTIVDARSIDDRLSRALVFLDYLDACWERSAHLRDKFDWLSLSASARTQVAQVRDRLHPQ